MTDRSPREDACRPASDAGDTAVPGRSLVCTAPAMFDRPAPTVRPQAAFLAQLLAVRAGVPQARLRRRADPDVGAAAYRDSLALRRAQAGLQGLDLDA